MATTVISTVANVLKEDLLPEIHDQLNSNNRFYKRFRREAATWDATGRAFTAVVALRSRHAQGVGQRAEGGALPTARLSEFQQTSIACKYKYGVVEFSGQLFHAGAGGKGLANVVAAELDSLVRTLKLDDGRQLWSDGSGHLGQINTSAGTVTTFAVDNPGVVYLEEGMVIDSYETKTGDTQGLNSVQITDVDRANNVVTVASSTIVENHYLFREDSVDANGNYEPMGLLGINDNGTLVATLQGIARAGNSWWKANPYTGSGALSQDMLYKAANESYLSSGDFPTAVVSNQVETGYYGKVLVGLRVINDRTDLEGGFRGLKFIHPEGSVDWITERYCPTGAIHFLDERNVMFVEAADYDWMERDGAMLHRLEGYDKYQAVMYKYCNLGATRCNGFTKLTGYSEPT
jgi:hypothetical protein